MQQQQAETVIIGAGIAGIATAYYLCEHGHKPAITLIDARAPMSFTSAQSGENYRNWWPHQTMVDFTNHSIDLMEQLAAASDNVFNMTRRGYVLATRQSDVDELIGRLCLPFNDKRNPLRVHRGSSANSYIPPVSADWQRAPYGIDVLTDPVLIRQTFPSFSTAIKTVVHLRRAGDISSQQLGQYMVEKLKAKGVRIIQSKVMSLDHDRVFEIVTQTGDTQTVINAERLVNAAGPFVTEIAAMLDRQLPVVNVLQQKIAFQDRHGAIPRDMPFSIDLDACTLDWDTDERELLAADDELAWLTQPIAGNIHCRPDGGEQGSWVRLGWAFNHQASEPDWEPVLDDQFPEIVLRAAAGLNPSLKTYYGRFPRAFRHYGGYYPMTQENWPLIGPTGIDGMYIVGALSGFGTMAACAAGELCARWLLDQPLPDYAVDLSLERYNHSILINELTESSNKGLL